MTSEKCCGRDLVLRHRETTHATAFGEEQGFNQQMGAPWIWWKEIQMSVLVWACLEVNRLSSWNCRFAELWSVDPNGASHNKTDVVWRGGPGSV